MGSPPAGVEVSSPEGEEGKKRLVTQDTLDSSSLSQTPSVSSEGTLSPVVRGETTETAPHNNKKTLTRPPP